MKIYFNGAYEYFILIKESCMVTQGTFTYFSKIFTQSFSFFQ